MNHEMTNKLEPGALAAYSQQFARQLCHTFFAAQPAVQGMQIRSFTPVPQVNSLVLYYLFTEWQRETERLKSPYFDYDSADVKAALQEFMNALSQHIAVKRDHFEPLVVKATAATITLFLTPYRFFDELLRDTDGYAWSVGQLRDMLRYVQINKSVLRALLDKVEADRIDNVYINEALAMLSTVFLQYQDTLEPPDAYAAQFSNVVPLRPEHLYEKRAAPSTPIAPTVVWEPHIPSVFNPDAPTIITPPVSAPGLEQFATAVNTPVPPAPYTPVIPPIQAPVPPSAPVNKPPVPPSKPVAPTVPFIIQSPTPASVPENPITKSVNERFLREQATLNDRLKTEPKATLLDKHRRQKVSDIKSAIPLNQKFLFINELFRGDNAAFNQALSEVESCTDYHSAVSLLNEKYAAKYQWDASNEEVNAFFEVIERKFY